MSAWKTWLFVGLQFLLPRYLLTAAIYRLARLRLVPLKNAFINSFIKLFAVDTDDAAAEVPNGYATFNDFFTRELRAGARPIDSANRSVVSPVDGTVSAAGPIAEGMLLQAKGHHYSLQDLLATDLPDAKAFAEGHFITIYLAPYNYHRVHAPVGGKLVTARYVPGDLFSVNEATVSQLAGLFTRNERLICHFTTDAGPVAVLFVGALNVGSISTPWTGEIRPRKKGVVEQVTLSESAATVVQKGDLLGWFNMGSTVIVLLPRGAATLRGELPGGTTVRMGEPLANLHSIAP